MSTTRRGFLKMIGIGSVAGPMALKAALKKEAVPVPVPVVTSGYMQVLSCGSGGISTFDPVSYVGEISYESCGNLEKWTAVNLGGVQYRLPVVQ